MIRAYTATLIFGYVYLIIFMFETFDASINEMHEKCSRVQNRDASNAFVCGCDLWHQLSIKYVNLESCNKFEFSLY